MFRNGHSGGDRLKESAGMVIPGGRHRAAGLEVSKSKVNLFLGPESK